MNRPEFKPLDEIANLLGRTAKSLRNIAQDQQKLHAGRRTSIAPHVLQSYPGFKKLVGRWGVWDDELQAWLDKHKG